MELRSAEPSATRSDPIVTALRPRGSDRIEVELDGVRWRVVPLEAVHHAGLVVGDALGRSRARVLRSELRRRRALDLALDMVQRRDHTASSLAGRLERRGIAPREQERAVAVLARAGLVDDGRFAHTRAALLAERGCGDLLIADDLERNGVSASLAAEAIEALEPERTRAAALVHASGVTAATLRRLAGKGFDMASLEPFVAELEDGA